MLQIKHQTYLPYLYTLGLSVLFFNACADAGSDMVEGHSMAKLYQGELPVLSEELYDTFDWGERVPQRFHLRRNKSINGVLVPGSDMAWQVERGSARFVGKPGLANGSLKLDQNTVLTLGRVPNRTVANVLRWDIPKATSPVTFGYQVTQPSHHLLVNQTTDAIYGSVNGKGVIQLNAVVGGEKIRAERAKIKFTGKVVHMELQLKPRARKAQLWVRDEASGEEVSTTLSWRGSKQTPTWEKFVINGSEGSILHSVGIRAPLSLPSDYPKNMSFKPLSSTKKDPNHDFDQVANAGLFALHHGQSSKLDDIKEAHPEVMTIAMNPKGIIPGIAGSSRNAETFNTFPGYFLYRAGTIIAKNINSSQRWIEVERTNVFKPTQEQKEKPDHVIIYALTQNGKPDWTHYEYARVEKVGEERVKLTRGRAGSVGRAFKKGKAVIAPIVPAWQREEDGEILFRLNYSLHAPRNPDPEEPYTAREIAAMKKGLALIYPKTGVLHDGLQHDVFRSSLTANPYGPDIDNDLTADWGFIDGVNSWNLGIQEYSRILRDMVGPHKVIQFDSTLPRLGYRGWRYVNGVQLETFMKGSRFSEAFEHLSHWVDRAEAKPAFSYGFCKTSTLTYGGDATNGDEMFRKQFAAGIMVGMPHPYSNGESFGLFEWDEFQGGELDDYGWLGRSRGKAKRDFSSLGQPLSGRLTYELSQRQHYQGTASGRLDSSKGLTLRVSKIRPNTKPVMTGVALVAQRGIELEGGEEYTLTFKAKAVEEVKYRNRSYYGLPMLIEITGHGSQRMYVHAGRDWRTYHLTFIAEPEGDDEQVTFKPNFGISERTGQVSFRDIVLRKGSAQRLSRDFERGKVLLNESETPWVVNLDSNQYQRINGVITPDVNDGSRAGRRIEVPPHDAVFLVKRD